MPCLAETTAKTINATNSIKLAFEKMEKLKENGEIVQTIHNNVTSISLFKDGSLLVFEDFKKDLIQVHIIGAESLITLLIETFPYDSVLTLKETIDRKQTTH